ncbi:hypothetical protein H072_2009 [Dactylellina haptotyla CBS 200.50]|uniref:HMG box domain-containing protein n=1 Tax=Dactylellina haptotyla (strain CBS 200.50) TaxID=1284197 RepID=S8AM06_DACHA|nr:hypothetical protein H072_2009 [Dactylellina haptotyla CBS 200.50]
MANSNKLSEGTSKKMRQSHNNKVPPDAPRRNLSSFVMFANSRRKELKEQYPDRAYPQIQSDISYEWERLGEEDKQRWKKAMMVDKERYRKEMELYRKYGPGWVWVIGHKMRQDLGLTDEDCTQLEFQNSILSCDASPRSGRSKSASQEDRVSKKKEGQIRHIYGDSEVRNPKTHCIPETLSSSTHARSTFSQYQPRPIFPENAIDYGEISASRSTRGNARAHSDVISDLFVPPTRCDHTTDGKYSYAEASFEEELFPQGYKVEIFSPTVFDGFGLETPWVDTHEWTD